MPWERRHISVEYLATSSKPIQERVGVAASNLLPLLEGDFATPEDVATFRRIGEALNSTAPTAYETSARTLTDDEAVAVAKDIFTLYGRYSESSSPIYRG